MTNTPQSPGEARAAAQQYVARGWFPIPVPHRRKGPVLDAWQDLRIAKAEDVRRYFNGRPQNLGILLGEPSGHLVDVDLDHLDAVAFADEHLPPTGSEFGRDGKRRSHRLYVVSNATPTRQWKDDQLGMISNCDLRASRRYSHRVRTKAARQSVGRPTASRLRSIPRS